MTDLLRSFVTAVGRLKEALHAEEGPLTKDAAIQRFEFSFELAWKALQKELRKRGIDRASPREVLRAAWSEGLLTDEGAWIAMLEDRNLTSHTYDEALAKAVFARLPAHAEALSRLARTLGSSLA